MQLLHQIQASRETFEALAKWYDEGNVKTIIPRPLEYGLLVFDKKEYVLFDRNEDVVRFAWHKSDEPYAGFEYNLETFELGNIGTVVKMEPSEEVYKPFFHITSVYFGAMSFIIANVQDEETVCVKHYDHQRIYYLKHDKSKLKAFSAVESAIGQMHHHMTYGKHA